MIYLYVVEKEVDIMENKKELDKYLGQNVQKNTTNHPMDCTPVLWEYNPRCFNIQMVSRICHATYAHPLHTTGVAWRNLTPQTPLGATRLDEHLHARCSYGKRRPTLPHAQRLRLHRRQRGLRWLC